VSDVQNINLTFDVYCNE